MVLFQFNKNNAFCISLMKSGSGSDSGSDSIKNSRWNRMENRFRWFGLEIARWIASTPADLVDEFHWNLNPFQKACSQSHIHIWRHIVITGLPYALIIEDDAMFDRNWLNTLTTLDIPVNDGWDAVFLNASEPMDSGFQWSVCREQFLTGAYILSFRGAQRLLNDFGHCFHAADWMTSRLQNYGCSYSYFPWLVIQEGRDSTIGSQVDADHAKVVRCLDEIGYSHLDHYL
jgi:hypothetical protein